MNPQWNWSLVILGAVLILIEIVMGASLGFDFLLIGSAILAGGVFGLLLRSFPAGLVVAGALSLLYVFAGRRRIRGRLRKPGLPSNVDALLGRLARVVQEITPDRPGRIELEGEEWRALPELEAGASAATARRPIPAGASVRIARVDGVTVYVTESGNPSRKELP